MSLICGIHILDMLTRWVGRVSMNTNRDAAVTCQKMPEAFEALENDYNLVNYVDLNMYLP